MSVRCVADQLVCWSVTRVFGHSLIGEFPGFCDRPFGCAEWFQLCYKGLFMGRLLKVVGCNHDSPANIVSGEKQG